MYLENLIVGIIIGYFACIIIHAEPLNEENFEE